jgi:Flp pilus assembly protein TadD
LSKALRVKESDQKTLSAVAVQFNNEASERLRDGDLAGAEKYFRRAFLLDAKNASAAAGVGQVLLKHEAFVGARAWAERALELDPKSGQALVVLGELAVYEGDEEKALKHYQEALAADPGNVRAHQEIYRIRHN